VSVGAPVCLRVVGLGTQIFFGVGGVVFWGVLKVPGVRGGGFMMSKPYQQLFTHVGLSGSVQTKEMAFLI
jgi:hypothetical protein